MREIGTNRLRTGQDAFNCFARHRCVPKPVVVEMGSYQGVDASGDLVAVGVKGVQPGGGIGVSLGCEPSKNQISIRLILKLNDSHPN